MSKLLNRLDPRFSRDDDFRGDDVKHHVSTLYESKNTKMRESGFTYVEAMIATVLLAVALVPIVQALSGTQESPLERDASFLNAARERMDTVLAMDIAAVPTGTGLSDTTTIGGTTIMRKVTVALYDLNGDAIPEPDAKRITVSVEGTTLQALKVN